MSKTRTNNRVIRNGPITRFEYKGESVVIHLVNDLYYASWQTGYTEYQTTAMAAQNVAKQMIDEQP